MLSSLGVVITNRDRPEPLRHCLLSLAVQGTPPRWVVIADLGSTPDVSNRLESVAAEFQVSYVGIDYSGPWKQGLAFNTALRRMPAAAHVVQLDADMILHPYLLEFTTRVLTKKNALGCVTSYAPDGAPSEGYDGSLTAYQKLLSVSESGIPTAIGGFMALPRDWLLERRGFDEAFVGWGFEDGDLWLRAQRELDVYCETTGSLLIHQAHARQPGASTTDGNPNWEIYSRRKAGTDVPVNPHSFGAAPVRQEVIREGIRRVVPAGAAEGPPDPWVRRAPLRRMRGGRVRPHYGPVDAATISLPSRLLAVRPSSVEALPFKVSAVVTTRNCPVPELRGTIDSLLNQTIPPVEILLSDQGSDGAYSRSYVALARQLARVRYVRSDCSGPWSRARAINAGLHVSSRSSTHVLITDSGLRFHPRLLDVCRLSQRAGHCFVHGHVQTVPPIAAELELVAGTPWEAWASVVYLDNLEADGWHFANRSWSLRRGLYDERWPDTETTRLAADRARRDRGASVLRLPPDWRLSFRATTHAGETSTPSVPLSPADP